MNPIEFHNVSKKFRKGEQIYALRDLIPLMTKGIFSSNGKKEKELDKGEFWALKDVNFSVKKGEVLGIIGPNGSGKSTILKLLAKLMVPNEGSIHVQGRLSALIEITAGFHPEFTGRENIYFNGAIMGMTKQEIDQKYEQIIEFSGVRDFIDTPVKRYSSGMSARLGFAVAAHVNPEIMLVDEVLSVGDMTFQAKCVQKMRDLLNSGTTIIFISHNIPLVQSLCERLVLLDKGMIVKEGYPEEVIPYYENIVSKGKAESIKRQMAKPGYQLEVDEGSFINIESIRLCNFNDKERKTFYQDEPIRIQVDYELTKDIGSLVFTYEIIRSDGVICCSSNTRDDKYSVMNIVGKNSIDINVKN